MKIIIILHIIILINYSNENEMIIGGLMTLGDIIKGHPCPAIHCEGPRMSDYKCEYKCTDIPAVNCPSITCEGIKCSNNFQPNYTCAPLHCAPIICPSMHCPSIVMPLINMTCNKQSCYSIDCPDVNCPHLTCPTQHCPNVSIIALYSGLRNCVSIVSIMILYIIDIYYILNWILIFEVWLSTTIAHNFATQCTYTYQT